MGNDKKTSVTTAIEDIQSKNGIIRSATHKGMADDEGFAIDDLKKLYARLTKGGASA